MHEMRRKKQAMTEEEARQALDQAEYGVLATVGEDGYPYAVPVNHALHGDRLYVHCAQAGHKLDNLAFEARVSYCVVTLAEVKPRELSTRYRSVVVFGRAERVQDPGEKREALEQIGHRFCRGFEAEVEKAIREEGQRTTVLRISIERMTGKTHD
jgi:hypothetical protein